MKQDKLVLIVDDDPDCLEQVTMILKSSGYDVISASSQVEAEELILRHQPCLAILDVMMEEADSGFILCHTLRKLYPEMPVILLTSLTAKTGMSFKSRDPRAQQWIKANVIMDKPVRPEDLRAMMDKLLQA